MSSDSQLVQRNCLTAAMPSLHEARWFAVRTRSRHEKIVTQQLQNHGIETFLPFVAEVRRWSDRKKEIEIPLFSGYTFVRVLYSSNEQRVRVLQTYGVVNFVGIQRSGVPIPDSQIENIKNLLAHKVAVKEHRYLCVGQRVRIRGGALDGLEGILAAHEGDRSLVISIEPIQRALSIRVEGYVVEPV